MKKIVLLSGNHICHNPRVVKEADALASFGAEVRVVGGATSTALKEKDKKVFSGRAWSYDYAYDLTKAGAGSFLLKLQRKVGELAFRGVGFANPWQISYGTGKLLMAARKNRADLTIAHWDPALPAAVQLLREGRNVGVDMEDWFSEDITEVDKKKRPVELLKKLEKILLCEGVYSSCTSEAMADALVQAYGCRRPRVIRNVFPAKEREKMDGKWKDRPSMERWLNTNDPLVKRPKDSPVSILWLSQTIGPGRGLETLFEALQSIGKDLEIHLRGNVVGHEAWLDRVCPLPVRRKVQLHPMVDNNEILSRLSEHDIGFCGELKNPRNRNLTISNKLFHYLSGGLYVVASDTEGQKEAAREAGGAVGIFTADDPVSLGRLLRTLMQDRSVLVSLRGKAWEAGKKLSWENEEAGLESVAR